MKIVLKYILLFVSLLIFSTPLYAENFPTVRASAQPKKITVGQIIIFKINIAGTDLKNLKIKLPENKIYYPPTPKKKNRDKNNKNKETEEIPEGANKVPLYIIQSVHKQDSSEKNMGYLSINMQIAYYRPGKYSLPKIQISFNGQEIKYGLPVVNVLPVNKDGKFQDIEGPMEFGGNYYRIIFLILGVLILAVVVFFAVRFFRKFKKNRMTKAKQIPPIQLFRKDLKKLNGEKLIKNGKLEEYVFGISLIFRKFLSSLLDFDAAEMTSEEINSILFKKLGSIYYKQFGDEIMKFFRLWDISKFAKFAPSDEILKANIISVSNLAERMSEELKDE